MADATANIGYFGVIVPAMNFYQGYFLVGALAAGAADYLVRARQMVGGVYLPPSATITPVEGVAEDDQAYVGATCAALVTCALEQNHNAVGTLGMALHQLTGYRYFLVSGTADRAGTNTRIVDLPHATSAADVRLAINRHPDVIRAQQAILKDLRDGKITH